MRFGTPDLRRRRSPDGAQTSHRESVRPGSDPPPERLGARPRTTPAGTTANATSPVAAETTALPTTSPGGKAPEAETRGPRLRTPERGTRNPGQQRPVHRVGPPRQSYSGAGGPQGTAWPRDERPVAAHPTPTARDGLSRAREPNHSRRRTGRSDTWARGRAKRAPDRAARRKAAKGQANPTSVGGCNANDPPRSREQPTGPVHRRERIRRRMTREAAFPERTKCQGNARRRKNRTGARAHRKGYRQRDKRRSGTVRGNGNTGRHGATSER
jgi:hypothetical protein